MAHLPIEQVLVVGAGGSGSIFVSHLCRIWQAWTRLGGNPFEITLVDPDAVAEANLARQCFCEADIGQPKALVLAQRMRAFYGIPVQAQVGKFTGSWWSIHRRPSLLVGCVDTLAARRTIAGAISHTVQRRQWGEDLPPTRIDTYWLDLGNSASAGQVVLGGHGLPTVLDLYPQMTRSRDRATEPSCSMAEALARQDLFINSTLANLAGHLLWHLLRHGGLNHHGYVANLTAGTTLPIPVPATLPVT